MLTSCLVYSVLRFVLHILGIPLVRKTSPQDSFVKENMRDATEKSKTRKNVQRVFCSNVFEQRPSHERANGKT
jgi:hypothetical protein